MRMRSIMIRPVLLAITVAAVAACVERTPELLQSGKINYSVDVAGCDETKGALYNEAAELKDGFFVDGYNAGDGTEFLSSEKVRYVGNLWLAGTDKNWPEGMSLTFYANANVPSSSIANVTSTKYGQTLTYTEVPASASSQNDIMLGYYSGNGGTTHTADIMMYHPLTSVVFRLGEIDGFTDSDKITRISISGVYKTGVCTATYSSSGPSFSWTHDEKAEHVVSDEAASGLAIASGDKKNIGTPFIIIPQDIATDKAYLSLTLTLGGVENELTCRLPESAWNSGEIAVYEINFDPILSVSLTPYNGYSL